MVSNRTLRIAAWCLAGLLALGACGGGTDGDATADAEEMTALEQMELTFDGSPSTEEIQEAMDDALNATNTSISEDSYSRAGSVLVTFRKDYGIDEMDILECIPTMTTDPRVPSVTFANVAAVCNVALVQGDR